MVDTYHQLKKSSKETFNKKTQANNNASWRKACLRLEPLALLAKAAHLLISHWAIIGQPSIIKGNLMSKMRNKCHTSLPGKLGTKQGPSTFGFLGVGKMNYSKIFSPPKSVTSPSVCWCPCGGNHKPRCISKFFGRSGSQLASFSCRCSRE